MAMERIPIARLDEFDALRTEWDDLRHADPHATLFLSWDWLRAYLTAAPNGWRILTVRERGRLIAALPVSIAGVPHRRAPIARELRFATAPFADYQGMLCRPEHETVAIVELCAMLQALRWDRARFSDVRDPRFSAVIARLAADGVEMRALEPSPCSAIALPSDWDTFLAQLSKATRRATQRPFKHLDDELPDWRTTSVSSLDDGEAHVDAALDVNALRWGSTPARRAKYRALFLAALARGCARVDVIWDGERPIAAGVSFVDPERGTSGLYLIGHDPAYARFSPGKAILAIAVRQAIALGYRTFDFMRGGESYKQSYATHEIANAHWELRRRSTRAVLLGAVQPAYAAVRTAFVRVTMPRRAV